MAQGGFTDPIHRLEADVVAAPAEIGVARFEIENHRLGKAGKHLALGFGHFGHLHHLPADVLPELDNAALQHMHVITDEFAIKIFGVAAIHHQAGLAQAAGLHT